MQDQKFYITTNRYKIVHEIRVPTKMSDYDYDYIESGRRFISFYLHTLTLYDIFTNVKIVEFSFPSESCADIAFYLYKSLYENIDQAFTITSTKGCIELVFRFSTSSTFSISVIENYRHHTDKINLFFNRGDVQDLINLLEIEIVDMYVLQSSDR